MAKDKTIKDNEKKSRVKAAKKNKTASTQLHLRISEITNDTLILKNGGVRAVLETSSINFSLKSEPEQESIIQAYQSFLNTLDYPIQIVVQSKKLDLDNYLANLKEIGDKQENPLLKEQTLQYIDYVNRLLEYADIMDKSFYVVIPYESLASQKTNFFTKFLQRIHLKETESDFRKRRKDFDQLKKGLDHRVNTALVGLENCGLKVKRLDTKELVSLFYKSNNPQVSRSQKIQNADDINLEG